jgi:hypothetical protein
LEAWIKAQGDGPDIEARLIDIEDRAQRQQLWINAPAQQSPTIIVPVTYRELLVRDTHSRMFHLDNNEVGCQTVTFGLPHLRAQ